MFMKTQCGPIMDFVEIWLVVIGTGAHTRRSDLHAKAIYFTTHTNTVP